MNQLAEFFRGLFATNKWPARWHCGEWSNFLGWTYITSELIIWTAYFLMPILIIRYFTLKRGIIKFRKVYVLFASFILLCGSTHFLDAMMFWIPMYRLNALVRLATGIVSLFTVYHLFKILPSVFKQKTNVELENEIARRELAEKNLDEANKNLEAFAYIASHDLQEPLRKMTTFTSRLYQTNADRFDDNSKVYIDKIMSSGERMQTMIKDILALSTMTEDMEVSAIELDEVIKIALTDLEIKILESGAIIEVLDLPVVKGNQFYLSQLFMNLIGNAIKFSKNIPSIRVTGNVENDKAIIYVKDNGIGIDKDDAKEIFVPFKRVHKKGVYEGSGIGLSICKKIVQLHGGEITVESKMGEGTTFIIELPMP